MRTQGHCRHAGEAGADVRVPGRVWSQRRLVTLHVGRVLDLRFVGGQWFLSASPHRQAVCRLSPGDAAAAAAAAAERALRP